MASAARRQSSSTSLAKYARAHSPDFTDHSLDFCNAFWGLGDVGVDVLFARLRGAMRTTEELRAFWKERAIIEDQYAKRLAALSRYTLGRDEIGEMRSSFDTLRRETEKQAGYHAKLAQQIRDDLEAGTNVFLNRQAQHKRQVQLLIEREFKVKQQQEAHVQRAREKYENDCTKINSYVALSALNQGKELEKIQAKLRNVQQTVVANERDFQQFTRELQETTAKWESRWKDFCDSCQDLEEERLEFMKDHMWGYANAISTICVQDDESCETIRLSLEQMEPEKDMENFVRDYGTGDAIPNPPAFVNYTDPNAVPSAAQRPTTRSARFERVSRRVRQPMVPPPEPEDNTPPENMVGVGAGGGRNDPPLSRSRSASRASMYNQAQMQERSSIPSVSAPLSPTTSIANGKTNGSVTSRSLEQSTSPTSSGPAAGGNVKVGQEGDPLARQLVELQKGIGSVRRGQGPSPQPGQSGRQSSPISGQPQQSGHRPRESVNQLAPPPGSRGGGPPERNPDYRRSAELVVGAFPTNIPSSRPASPNAPTAVMALPPNSQQNNSMVQNVIADYQQSFPGERKSVSRPGSRAGSISGPAQPQQLSQPMSGRPDSMIGVGANGRSPSPQPFLPASRGASPMQAPRSISPAPAAQPQRPADVSLAASPYQVAPPQNVVNTNKRNSMRVPPPGSVPTAINGAHPGRQSSISVPQQQPARAASPNPVGIALDQSGRVAVDEMADHYLRRQPSIAPSVQQGYRHPVQPQPQPQQQQRQPPPPQAPPPIQQPPYAAAPQRQPSYPPPGQPMYAPPPPAAAPGYSVVPGYSQPPQMTQQNAMQHPSYHYGQPPVAQPPQDYGRVNGQPVRHPSMGAGSYYGNVPPPQQPPHQQPPHQQPSHQQPPPQTMGYARAVSPAPPQPTNAAAAPPPAGYTDDGRPILFYVKALYDYQSVIDEEFDFQAGDIIAVTATPEDGWWSGELLDEQRRVPGKHVFPSNFVDLLN